MHCHRDAGRSFGDLRIMAWLDAMGYPRVYSIDDLLASGRAGQPAYMTEAPLDGMVWLQQQRTDYMVVRVLPDGRCVLLAIEYDGSLHFDRMFFLRLRTKVIEELKEILDVEAKKEYREQKADEAFEEFQEKDANKNRWHVAHDEFKSHQISLLRIDHGQ